MSSAPHCAIDRRLEAFDLLSKSAPTLQFPSMSDIEDLCSIVSHI